MASNRAPKQWFLTTKETLNTYKNWKENLVYTLTLDPSFAPYLRPGVTWLKQSAATPNRGFTDDATGVANGKTKEEKCTTLNLMLGQIANWTLVIARNEIIERSVSLNDIWNKIRAHYNFHSSGSKFLDLTTVKLKSGERAEDLYQRLVAFFDDNLHTVDSGLTHHSALATRDEEISPTLENVVVLLWLERVHVGLPALVKQRYGTELRNKTLASIKPEISQALSSLLEELSAADDSRVSRITHPRQRNPQPKGSSGGKYCCLCRTANRSNYKDHYLSQCRYLPEDDRKRMNGTSPRVRFLETDDDSEDDDQQGACGGTEQHGGDETENNDLFIDPPPAIQRRVTTRKSPRLQCFYGHIPISLCLDSGAESNMISLRSCNQMGIRPSRTNQGAKQADQKTSMNVIGEIGGVEIHRGSHVFELDALVIKDDIGDILAGEPFLEKNDVAIRPAKRQIIIRGREVVPYSSL